MRADSRARNANILFMIAALILLICMCGSAAALGIGPSRQYITFAPGQTMEGEFILINDAAEEFKAGAYVQGDLAEYITISAPLVDVSSKDASKQIPYTLKFPAEMPRPGEHRIEVVVRQFPPDTAPAEGTTISANMAVIAQIIIKVPYPGKYAEGKLFISGSEKTDAPMRFGIAIYNFGTEQIDEAYVEIQVFDPKNERVADFSTDKKGIKSKEEGNFIIDWTPDVPKGTYKAIATFHYDGKHFIIEQGFDIGSFVIDVSDISAKNFRLGDVAKFDILLFNSWNTELKDVYVEMLVEDSTGKRMTEFKTGVVDIPSQQAKQLEAYWYTEGVAPGIYKVKLIVHYSGKMTQKEYDFEVSTNSMTRLGAAGQAISEQEKSEIVSQGVIIMLILIVLALLIGMNIVWFYFLSKRFKKKGGEE